MQQRLSDYGLHKSNPNADSDKHECDKHYGCRDGSSDLNAASVAGVDLELFGEHLLTELVNLVLCFLHLCCELSVLTLQSINRCLQLTLLLRLLRKDRLVALQITLALQTHTNSVFAKTIEVVG